MNHNELYKTKYQELKLKFLNSVDLAWRLGYEAGLQSSQQQQMAQTQPISASKTALPDAQQPAEPANGQPQPGQQQPGQPAEAEEKSEHPDGSELDQHIAELEGMLGKSEIRTEDLQKLLSGMKLQKSVNKSDSPHKKIVENVMNRWHDEEERMSKEVTIDTLTSKL